MIKDPLPSTQTLTYIISKPYNETAELMLANTGESSMTWSLTNSSDDPGEIEWFASPNYGTLPPFGELLIEVVARTAGLNARATPYTAKFELHSDDVCICRDQTVEMGIELVVSAETSAANSFVEILHPSRAEAADSVVFYIFPADDEGLIIEDSAEIQFNPVLTHAEEDITVLCGIVYLSANNVHKGKCALPTLNKIPLAGSFNLSVTLNSGELIGGTEYGLQVTSCPKDWFFHRPTGRCVECDLDKSICRGGKELPVPKKGYWADLEHAELGYMYTCNYPGASCAFSLSHVHCVCYHTYDTQPV